MLQTALEHSCILSRGIPAERVPHGLVVMEAGQRRLQGFRCHALIAKPVVEKDNVVQPGIEVFALMERHHVAAAHAPLPAPVAGALVHNEHVLHVFTGFFRGPQTGEAAADHKYVGIQNSDVAHLGSPSIMSSVRGSRSLKGCTSMASAGQRSSQPKQVMHSSG